MILIQVFYLISQPLKLENHLHQLYYHQTNMIFILEMHYLILIQVIMQQHGGILSSTGFKIDGNDNEMFLDDDGEVM